MISNAQIYFNPTLTQQHQKTKKKTQTKTPTKHPPQKANTTTKKKNQPQKHPKQQKLQTPINRQKHPERNLKGDIFHSKLLQCRISFLAVCYSWFHGLARPDFHLHGIHIKSWSHGISQTMFCQGTLNLYMISSASESPLYPKRQLICIKLSICTLKLTHSSWTTIWKKITRKLWITVLTMNIEVKILFGTSSYVFHDTDIPARICYLGIQNLRKRNKIVVKWIYKATDY